MRESGLSSSVGGVGKTTVEMQQGATFSGAGWDMTVVWGIVEGGDYPRLRVFGDDFALPAVAMPQFTPDGGAHPGTQVVVTVSCATDGATMRYTLDGSVPATNSPAVAQGATVAVAVPGTLRARAWKAGMAPSPIKDAVYTAAAAVATPQFDPDGGSFVDDAVAVTVTCATPGATIRYTVDGSEPATGSPEVAHGAVVAVPVPGMLRVRAWKEGNERERGENRGLRGSRDGGGAGL
jgi:hypothetical protein